jgi:hypothetical protein
MTVLRYIKVSFVWCPPSGAQRRQTDWVLASNVSRAFEVIQANYAKANALKVEKFRDVEVPQ